MYTPDIEIQQLLYYCSLITIGNMSEVNKLGRSYNRGKAIQDVYS